MSMTILIAIMIMTGIVDGDASDYKDDDKVDAGCNDDDHDNADDVDVVVVDDDDDDDGDDDDVEVVVMIMAAIIAFPI